jgi:hypothetical protein
MLRLVAAPLLLFAACGGGRSGTGISDSVADLVATQPTASDGGAPSDDAAGSVLSIIEGNVAQVTLALRSPRKPAVQPTFFASLRRVLSLRSVAIADGVEGIHVSVDGSDASADTDPNGAFSLSGPFSGTTVLRFQRADDGIDATMTVTVPRGGSLSLRDLTIESGSGQASSQRQDLSFDAIVETVDCAKQEMQVVSRFDTSGQRYLVDLSDSSVTDENGQPVNCFELQKGDPAHVDGEVRPNGTIDAGSITVEPETNAGVGAAANAGTVAKPPAPPVGTPPSLAAPTPSTPPVPSAPAASPAAPDTASLTQPAPDTASMVPPAPDTSSLPPSAASDTSALPPSGVSPPPT